MNLIKCNNCGGKLSDKANICPHCKCSIEKETVIKTVSLIPHSDNIKTNSSENDYPFYRSYAKNNSFSELQDMRSHGIGHYRSDFQENFIRSKRHPHLDNDK